MRTAPMIWDLKKICHPDDILIRAEPRIRDMLRVNAWSNGENCEILLGGSHSDGMVYGKE